MYEQHKCSSSVQDASEFVCLEPKQQQNLQESQLEGTWYVLNGYNRKLDCYACQQVTFSTDPSNREEPFELNFVYSGQAANGTTVWNDRRAVGFREFSGIFWFYGRENGITLENEWTVLFASK
jgi:hypothetical protein